MGLDTRYVAGLFDGEGWITINKWAVPGREYIRYQLFVGIGMVHKPVIDAMHETFAGNVFVKHPSVGQSERTRTGFLWRLSSNPAANFLRQISPYLIVKKDEADLAIEFQTHMRAHTTDFKYKPHLRPELYEYRDAVYLQLRAFKRREYFTPVDGDPMLAA